VCNPAYPYLQYEIFFIAEQPSGDKYRPGSVQLNLNDDEIADIRAELQRITRRRITNINDAEDIVQDTLLTLIMRNPGDELKKGLLVWCQGILRNKVGNYYRKSRRQSFLMEKNAWNPPWATGTSATTFQETSLSAMELRSILSEKVAALPPLTRQAMEMLLSGFETGEIADRLPEESYQNVINRLYRGRKKLARELIRCGFRPHSRKHPDRENPDKAPANARRKVS
jgi:RNA polymerase sigma factor (sigma-70 family)